MRYFLVAGEASGDLHGANLIRGIKKADPEGLFYCWGGDKMEAAGAKLLMHYRHHSIMGFAGVLFSLNKILKNLSLCKRQIIEYKPDVLILIDYPGFNLRIARFAKSAGLTVFYYISPKLWAWNESRVKIMKKFTDRIFVIFPFEVEFYRKHGIEVKYLGNPLVDEISEWKKSQSFNRESFREKTGLGQEPIIAVLPGSRNHEIKHILPQIASLPHIFPDHTFVIAGVRSVNPSLYEKFSGNKKFKVVFDMTYELLSVADAALVKSGTSTLEAALLNVPQVVCYRGDFISMAIAGILVKVKYISLVNLIAGKEIVKELIQYRLNKKRLTEALIKILPGGSERDRVIEDYRQLEKILGPAGASDRTGAEMVSYLKTITV